jgi:hypothetical protein
MPPPGRWARRLEGEVATGAAVLASSGADSPGALVGTANDERVPPTRALARPACGLVTGVGPRRVVRVQTPVGLARHPPADGTRASTAMCLTRVATPSGRAASPLLAAIAPSSGATTRNPPDGRPSPADEGALVEADAADVAAVEAGAGDDAGDAGALVGGAGAGGGSGAAELGGAGAGTAAGGTGTGAGTGCAAAGVAAGGIGASRAGSSESGSTYPCSSAVTRTPRCT